MQTFDPNEKADRDNRSNQLNDNNDKYYQSRGLTGKPDDDDDDNSNGLSSDDDGEFITDDWD